jgi:hypothetical protein
VILTDALLVDVLLMDVLLMDDLLMDALSREDSAPVIVCTYLHAHSLAAAGCSLQAGFQARLPCSMQAECHASRRTAVLLLVALADMLPLGLILGGALTESAMVRRLSCEGAFILFFDLVI